MDGANIGVPTVTGSIRTPNFTDGADVGVAVGADVGVAVGGIGRPAVSAKRSDNARLFDVDDPAFVLEAEPAFVTLRARADKKFADCENDLCVCAGLVASSSSPDETPNAAVNNNESAMIVKELPGRYH